MKSHTLKNLLIIALFSVLAGCQKTSLAEKQNKFLIPGNNYKAKAFDQGDLGTTTTVYPLSGRDYLMLDIKNTKAWDTHGLVELAPGIVRGACQAWVKQTGYTPPTVKWLFLETDTKNVKTLYLMTSMGTVSRPVTVTLNPNQPAGEKTDEIALGTVPLSNQPADGSLGSFDFYVMFNGSLVCGGPFGKTYQVEVFPATTYPDSQDCNKERPDIAGEWGQPKSAVFHACQVGSGAGNEPDHP